MKTYVAALSLAAAVLTSGCATGGQRFTHSGFLDRYDDLARAKRGNVAFWTVPGYRASDFATAIVEPAEWRAPHRGDGVEQRLREAFRQALIDRLARRYRIVDAAAADGRTLRVRAAITNTRRTRWFVNAPIQVASTLTFGGLSLLAPFQGGASVEVEVTDAKTGSAVSRIAAFRNGKPWNVKGSYVAYDHARLAFADAADQLGRVLDGTIAADGSKSALSSRPAGAVRQPAPTPATDATPRPGA